MRPCWLADLQATPPQADNLQLLQDLLVARRKLVAQLGTLRKLTAALNPQAARRLTKPLASLQAARTACERDLRTCLAADAVLARRAEIIQSIPGCGPLNAACLCATMPELGSLGRRPACYQRLVAKDSCQNNLMNYCYHLLRCQHGGKGIGREHQGEV